MNVSRFFAELGRCNVYKSVVSYAVASCLVFKSRFAFSFHLGSAAMGESAPPGTRFARAIVPGASSMALIKSRDRSLP